METQPTSLQWLDWPAPSRVQACYSLRDGGVSQSPYHSFNMSDHVGDTPEHVRSNRQQFSQLIQQTDITWLEQVHGVDVYPITAPISSPPPYPADASVTSIERQVCCVMTADCLPVFFCNQQGTQVAVAHAGWRGLLNGVLQNTLQTFVQPEQVLVYLGPAISQQAFEVGDEVRAAFVNVNQQLSDYFIASSHSYKWMADLYGMARFVLQQQGVVNIYGGDRCTYTEDDFFSYRRDGVTGRMANAIWLNEPMEPRLD